MSLIGTVDSIRCIRINNPPLNTLSRETRIQLMKDLKSAVDDERVEVIILVGAGQSFCVGADIRELAVSLPRGKESEAMQAYVDAYKTHNLAPLVHYIDSIAKPVVAVINGECFGGGLELALGCHYRVCTERSAFRFPEVLVGIIPRHATAP
jgi:enoyl-CoA hydratase/carnithine racemase